MRKRRIYLVLLILAVAGVFGLIVAGAFREREPEYGGKKLSEWVETGYSWDNFQKRRAGTDEAVRHLGTNTIPFLLKWIRYEQPVGKGNLFIASTK